MPLVLFLNQFALNKRITSKTYLASVELFQWDDVIVAPLAVT